MNPTSVRLTQAMQKENMSIEELSDRAGVPQEKIQSYLDGTRLLGMDPARRLGRVLRVRWTWLMGYGDD